MTLDEVKWLGSLLEKSIEGEVDPEKILSFTKGEITKDDLSDEELGEVSGGVVTPGGTAMGMLEFAGEAAGTGVGIPVAIGIVAANVITVTRSWGKVGRGVSRAARAVGRAFRRW